MGSPNSGPAALIGQDNEGLPPLRKWRLGATIGHVEGNTPGICAECTPMFVLVWLPTARQQPCALLPCTCAACQRTMCCQYLATPRKGVSTAISTTCLSMAMLAFASSAPIIPTCHALQRCLLLGTCLECAVLVDCTRPHCKLCWHCGSVMSCMYPSYR